MKLKYKIFCIVIAGVIAVFISYIALNFRWHLVLRDNKVIEYKAGLVDKNIRNLTVYIPEGTTEIMEDAFSDCKSIEKVYIPESVKIIHRRAFIGCKNLKEINLPESLEKIDRDAFNGCTSLEVIRIPKNVEYIGESAFSGCTDLKKYHCRNHLKR